MKLSISNIGWDVAQDAAMYELMNTKGYSGLEIAPTRIFPEAPYDRLREAAEWRQALAQQYGFVIPSMQSIWFGRQEKLFASDEERTVLLDYTKKAIDFASVIGCRNLVFGCPRNRAVPEGVDSDNIIWFFKELGDYAFEKNTVIGIEANPTIYNTNYINDTSAALKLIRKVDSRGFMLNLDVGTMIQNEESVGKLTGQVCYINHVHISEPGLKPIEKRELHSELLQLLKKEDYHGFVSIEMGKIEDMTVFETVMEYVEERVHGI